MRGWAWSKHSKHCPEKESRGERRRVLSGMLAELAQGQPLSIAMSRYPQHFPALYTAMVRASERTGNLKQALVRYIGYREELDRVRGKILAAMIYPVILMIVGTMVMAFLMFYVVPRFSKVYEDISGELPIFLRLLLGAGRTIEAHGWIVALVLVAALGATGYAVTRQDLRARMNEQLWRIPALGERMRVYQLGRFYRTLGMLLRGGIPILPAVGYGARPAECTPCNCSLSRRGACLPKVRPYRLPWRRRDSPLRSRTACS